MHICIHTYLIFDAFGTHNNDHTPMTCRNTQHTTPHHTTQKHTTPHHTTQNTRHSRKQSHAVTRNAHKQQLPAEYTTHNTRHQNAQQNAQRTTRADKAASVRGRTAQEHTSEGKGEGADGGDKWGGEGEGSRFPKAQVCIRETERET
jgi:hypothetical protein